MLKRSKRQPVWTDIVLDFGLNKATMKPIRLSREQAIHFLDKDCA
jgi:hypothetical protein